MSWNKESAEERRRKWSQEVLPEISKQGISPELFRQSMLLLYQCQPEACSGWVAFAEEIVRNGQFVDFDLVGEPSHEVNRWLETFVAGLLQVQAEYGPEIARKMSQFSLHNLSLYPYEMLEAAKQFEMGASIEEIEGMMVSGLLDDCTGHFPKLTEQAPDLSEPTMEM